MTFQISKSVKWSTMKTKYIELCYAVVLAAPFQSMLSIAYWSAVVLEVSSRVGVEPIDQLLCWKPLPEWAVNCLLISCCAGSPFQSWLSIAYWSAVVLEFPSRVGGRGYWSAVVQEAHSRVGCQAYF